MHAGTVDVEGLFIDLMQLCGAQIVATALCHTDSYTLSGKGDPLTEGDLFLPEYLSVQSS